MDSRKIYISTTVLALSILVLAAVMAYATLDNENAYNGLTGVPLALGSVSTMQVGEQQFNTISVTGSGTASMQANEATIVLGAQTQHVSASEAVRLNAEIVTNVIDAIKTFGISEDDMKTVSFNVYPVHAQYDYNMIIGYRAVNMISVETNNMELIGKVIDAAVEHGANQIQGVSFALSEENQSQLRKQAYLAALEDAEAKALLIAEKLELTITGVLYIGESTYQPYQPYNLFSLERADTSTPILEGKLAVSVTINVTYAFS